ncbi:MAG: hypothetical protein QM788_15380 [Roseateles sp.]|uniref:DUF6701 domain-containing protein n=1 Tax=Roseateles sp. TaxID=1971397 RepID=UPI0039E9534A
MRHFILIIHLGCLLPALLLPLRAAATAYVLPGNLPPGCTANGASYSCPSLTLAYGDTLAVNAPRPATLTINGDFATSNGLINQGGSTGDLKLVVTGQLSLGHKTRITGNISAYSVHAVDDVNNVGIGAIAITGSVAATGGNLSLGDQTTVSGSVTAAGSGSIVTGRGGQIGGNVSGGSGLVTISRNGSVSGNVTGNGGITVGQEATVFGNLAAGTSAVTLDFRARVAGSLTTTHTISLGQESRVDGPISGGSGNVTVGYGARVAGSLTTGNGSISFEQSATALSCVQSTGTGSITLGYQSKVDSVCCGGSCGSACVANNSTYATPPPCNGGIPASFAFSGTGSASTCSPQALTITARDANGNTLTTYAGTMRLSTSTGTGTWTAGSGPAPAGSLVPGPANSGKASYTFAAADLGVVRLRLAHGLAQNLTVTAVDSASGASSSTSAVIGYRDNAFRWADDLDDRIAGSFVAVAGRPHDLRVELMRKDPSTGVCGVASDYAGSRAVKLWRSDSGGPWTPPTVAGSGAAVPAGRPAANNLTLAFTAGIARFDLATSDVGRYALNLEDDSLSKAATAVSGSSPDLSVRPFTLAVTGLALAGTANPGGSAPADAVFGAAGAPFSATVTAYRWASGADADDDGLPDPGSTLAQVSAGGAAPGFGSAVTLAPVAGAQTPAGGTLGALANNVVGGFSGGAATTGTLAYAEVGSFLLKTQAVVANYLGSAGLNLDALVFNAAGSPQPRVGRFVPAGFALSGGGVTHRVDQACPSPSAFTYLGERFRLGFTLTARNAAGATTRNYSGDFARLDLAAPAQFKLAGIAGSEVFNAGNGRLAASASSGSWSAGVASGVTLTARVTRAAAPAGPYDTAAFGIAPVDPDGVAMLSPDLDTDSPANGADRVRVGGTIPLRHGRLRLQNAIGAAGRPLHLPLAAQHWADGAYTTNTLDSCTRIRASDLSFGNLRKSLTAGDAAMGGSSSTVAQGIGRLTLAAPGGGRVGSLDVAIALDAASPPADASCLKTPGGWTPAKAASTGAGLEALRAPWCGSTPSDPAARASWGLYRGGDGVLYQRENY